MRIRSRKRGTLRAIPGGGGPQWSAGKFRRDAGDRTQWKACNCKVRRDRTRPCRRLFQWRRQAPNQPPRDCAASSRRNPP
ncbi:hypothetical protein [Lysobacter gummosus]|uniref:hypothetical protein n=1 Tax=Lysobacter gummosus TaxID=262324 RepID=UPI0036260FEF